MTERAIIMDTSRQAFHANKIDLSPSFSVRLNEIYRITDAWHQGTKSPLLSQSPKIGDPINLKIGLKGPRKEVSYPMIHAENVTLQSRVAAGPLWSSPNP